MTSNRQSNESASPESIGETLLANQNAINETSRLRIKHGNQNVVAGGKEIPDFDPRISFVDGQWSVTAPSIPEGGNPKDALFKKILADNGDQIAARVQELAQVSEGRNVFKGFSLGLDVAIEKIGLGGSGGADFASNNLTGRQNVQDNFDIKFAQAVYNWANDNPNGASFKLGDKVVAYDRPMVDEIRQNALDRLNQVVERAFNSSEAPGENKPGDTQRIAANGDAPTPANRGTPANIGGERVDGTDPISASLDRNPAAKSVYNALKSEAGDAQVAGNAIYSLMNNGYKPTDPNDRITLMTSTRGEQLASVGDGALQINARVGNFGAQEIAGKLADANPSLNPGLRTHADVTPTQEAPRIARV
jgi:hypothetical protein